MEDRRSKLESITEKTLERLSALEVDLAVVKSNYATKEDLAKMEGTLLKWFIGHIVIHKSAGAPRAALKVVNFQRLT